MDNKINLITRIDLSKNFYINEFENNNVHFEFSELIVKLEKQRNKQVEKELFEYMYNMFKENKKYSQVYIISEREFEKFLKFALPLWKEHTK